MTLNATLEMLRRIQALRLQESPALKAAESIAESVRQAPVRHQSQIANIVQDIAKSTRLADRLRQESPTIKIMQSIVESARRPSLGGLPTARMLQDLDKAASLMKHIRQESSAMKAMQSIAESARQASVRQQSQITNMIQDIAKSTRLPDRLRQESPTIKIMQSIAESARQASVRHQSQITSMIQDIANSTKLVDSLLQESNAMKALRQISNLPFSSIVREMQFPELSLPDIGQTEFDNYSEPHFSIDQDAELEVQRELEGSNNYNLLSDRSKSYLMKFFLYFLLPIITNLLSSVVIDTRMLQTELIEYKTTREVKSYIRKGTHSIDKELLRGYRVLTGSAVRLRRIPNMKSEIVALLPLGTLIEVLNESNRSWLLVEVDVEGQRVVGWISRRYTKKFN